MEAPYAQRSPAPAPSRLDARMGARPDGDAAASLAQDREAGLSGGGRRRTGEPVSALLKRSQATRLGRLAMRNRVLAAEDVTNLLFERLGLIRRIGDVRPHRLQGFPAVEWAITEAGRAALREVGSGVTARTKTSRGDYLAAEALETARNTSQAAAGTGEAAGDGADPDNDPKGTKQFTFQTPSTTSGFSPRSVHLLADVGRLPPTVRAS